MTRSAVAEAVLHLENVVRVTALERVGPDLDGPLLMKLARHLCTKDGNDPDWMCIGQNYSEPLRSAKGTYAIMLPLRCAWECYLRDAIAALELMKREPHDVIAALSRTPKK